MNYKPLTENERDPVYSAGPRVKRGSLCKDEY